MTYMFEFASGLDDEEDLFGTYSNLGDKDDYSGRTEEEEYDDYEFDPKTKKWKTSVKRRAVDDDSDPDFTDMAHSVLDRAWGNPEEKPEGENDPDEIKTSSKRSKSTATAAENAQRRREADQGNLEELLRNGLKELIDAYQAADQEAGRPMDMSPEAQKLRDCYENFFSYNYMSILRDMQAYGLYRHKKGEALPKGACEPVTVELLASIYYLSLDEDDIKGKTYDPELETMERVAGLLNDTFCGRTGTAYVRATDSIGKLLKHLAKKDETEKKMMGGDSYTVISQSSGNTGSKCYFTSGEYIDGIAPIIQRGDKSSKDQAQAKAMEYAQLGAKMFKKKYNQPAGLYPAITAVLRDESTKFYPYSGGFYGNTPGPESKNNMVAIGINLFKYLSNIVANPQAEISSRATTIAPDEYKEKLGSLLQNAKVLATYRGKPTMMGVPYQAFSEFLDANMLITVNGEEHPLFVFWRTATDTRSSTVVNPEGEDVNGEEAQISAGAEKMREESSSADSTYNRNHINLNAILSKYGDGLTRVFNELGVAPMTPEDTDYTKITDCANFLVKLSARVKASAERLKIDGVPEINYAGETPQEGITATAKDASRIGLAWAEVMTKEVAPTSGGDPVLYMMRSLKLPIATLAKTMVQFVSESGNREHWTDEGMNNPIIHLGMAYASLAAAYENGSETSFSGFDDAMAKLACNYIVDMAAGNGIDLFKNGLIDDILTGYDRMRQKTIVSLAAGNTPGGKPASLKEAAAIRRRADRILARTPEYRLNEWISGLHEEYGEIETGKDIIKLLSDLVGTIPAPTGLPLLEGEEDDGMDDGYTPAVGDAAYLMLLVYMCAIRQTTGDTTTDVDYVTLISSDGRKSSVKLLDLLREYGWNIIDTLADTLTVASVHSNTPIEKNFPFAFRKFCTSLLSNGMNVNEEDRETLRSGQLLQNNDFVTFTNTRMK